MARARNIKPGLYKNDVLAECSIWARYIFPGLWMLADREGRLEDRPKRIKGELLPFDVKDVDELLSELQHHGFILRYQIDGARYIQISKFKSHQNPHYTEKPSVIKAPQLPECVCHHEDEFQEDSRELLNRNPLIPDSLKSDSRIPDSPIPDSPIPDKPNPLCDAVAPRPEKRREKKINGAEHPTPPTRETWASYSAAYRRRYGTDPVPNAKVNSLIKRFVQSVPADEAPSIAAFYVEHNGRFYVSKMHCVEMLLKDAEKLHTEWVTGRRMTSLEARGAEQTDALREQSIRVGKLLEGGEL